MLNRERERERKEKPFEGKKVYFGASIKGAKVHDPALLKELVQFMKEGGADVLSEQVAAETREEMDELYFLKTGVRITEVENPKVLVRRNAIKGVDEADYMVMVVTSPSIGVGMELQRGIDKGKLGLNHTKILCLCRQDVLDEDDLTLMVTGIEPGEHSDFHVFGYTSAGDAKEAVFKFLTDSSNRG